ncbi:MAG: TonB-dependent receptor [Spongiibacteraceae bacterium]
MNIKGHQVFSPSMIKSTLTAAISIASTFPCFGVQAAEDGDQLRAIEEVVVSARRREESLQEVPVAVSAFGAEQIKERGIATEADLQMSTPGLMVRATNSSNQLSYSLRGQSIDAFSYSAPAVLAYVNEVQAGGISASSFFDMASIQVLKGPQGTLFGRNATGGAVLYATQAPEEEFGGYVKVGVGSYSNRLIEGAINVPVTDNLFARVAGMTRSRDGWQDNLFNGDKLAEIDTDNVRLSLLYTGNRVENSFVGYEARHKGRPEGLRAEYSYVTGQQRPDGNGALNSSAYDIYSGGADAMLNPRANELGFTDLAAYFSATADMDFHDVYNSLSSVNDIEQSLYSNATTFEVSDALVFKGILGYNKVESFQGTDLDGTAFNILDGTDSQGGTGYQYNTEQKSIELQVSGTVMDDRLDYIAGVFWSNETFRNSISLCFFCDAVLAGAPDSLIGYDFETTDKSKAIFAQVTYALTDKINVTAGYRHTWEDFEIDQFVGKYRWLGDINRISAGTQPADTTFDKPSWLLSIDYTIDDSNMVYASQRGSWRTGGFNGTAVDGLDPTKPDSFDPESTYDVELGYKFSGYLADIPSQVNVAVFRQIVKDVQKTAYVGLSSLTGNVGEAEINGLELDFKFDVLDWLELGGAYAYTNAKFTDPTTDLAGFNGEFGNYGDSPENSYSLYAVTTNDIEGVGVLRVRADWYKVTDAFYTNTSKSVNPNTIVEGYELVNFRVGLDEIAGSAVSAAAFVRNALDEEYIRGGLPLGAVIGINSTIAGEPRTVGVELTYNF